MSYHKPSNIEMPRRLLRCLRGLDWLNDEVINIYMGLLQVCAESSLPSSCSGFLMDTRFLMLQVRTSLLKPGLPGSALQ